MTLHCQGGGMKGLEEGEDEGEGGELSVDPHPYPLPKVGEGGPCRATPIYCGMRVSYFSAAQNTLRQY